ncbi:hemolysin activation protein [Yersinia pseudotuberculosis]|uniref:Hemolysin activation protein n=3 Tax=Yersinia TaxID=629 RepID=A0A0T9R5A6_9GAMM|nr:hemolysin activation protein [Yersinia similis]BCU88874.1 hemolysin activation protein [Yersinia pseudotuberculosis]CFQ68952.1 hemolysin activator protein [Yersinia similis]CNF41167.1 hemolysin activator protein [Yersinia similis]CNG30111.1 hemolysin activator protein [Yersinia similis]
MLPVNLTQGQKELRLQINLFGQSISQSDIMIRKRTALWLVLSTGAQADTTLAIEAPPSINESRQSLQNNAKEINQLVEETRYQQMTQHNTGQGELSRPENTAAPELPEDTQCLPINGVYIQGITLLTEDDLNELSAIPEQCIHSENINLLTRELTNIYMDKGYITARIQFIPPDADGKLGLDITEGFVEAIDSTGTGLDGETVFPNMIGKPLNITRLDQGLDQANRLPSNKVTVDILPGTLPGGSILKLHNTPSTPWHLTTSLDNYGNKNTGEWLSRNTLSFDNPLGLSDSASINISNTVDRPQHNYSRAYSMFYSVPYGALTFSGFGSYAEYRYPMKLQFNTAKLHGETQQHGLRADYVFYRDQNQINGLSAQLTYKRASNYLNEEKISISSPTLTIFELGLNHLHVLPMGLFNINVSIEQGLPWLGAERSNGPLANYQDSQFTKAKASITSNHYFALFDDAYLFSNQFYGQYTRDRLPGVEWLSITDSAAIRGFSRNTLSADQGWYLQNTLSRRFTLGDATLTPRVGLDTGRIQQKPQGWVSAMGLSAGVSLNYQNATLDIEASRGRLLSGQSKINDPTQILARFSYRF